MLAGATMSRSGRKRKMGVARDAAGRSRNESRPDEIRAVVLAQRVREVGAAHAADPLAGSSLGRLLLRGDITQAWHDAGDRWAALVRRHAVLMGYSITRSAPSFVMVGNGLSCRPEPDEDVITRTRRDYSDCYRALMNAGLEIREGTSVALICYAVCVDDRAVESLSEHDINNLRAGLGALAKVLG
jgi:hypothetical protein